MSHKIAKRIRAEIKYHPKQPRSYVQLNMRRRTITVKGKKIEIAPSATIEIDPKCSRSLYREMKKEARNGYSR